jgi:TonB family protein
MLAGKRDNRSIRIVGCCLLLSLYCHPAAAASASIASAELEEWDRTELTLRKGIWTLYEGSAALGKDPRGRTLEDDLESWVMSSAVRKDLKAARARTEQQLQKGDSSSARANWEFAKGILDEQSKHLSLITLYWSERTHIERLRRLWLNWVKRAPDPFATESKERIDGLVSKLTTDYAPTISLQALASDITELKTAYDQERRKLAALVSAQLLAAGEKIATRDRTLFCGTPASAPSDGAGNQTSSAAENPAHPAPTLLTSPSADEFYPTEASRDAITGDVIIQVTVGVDGCMVHAEISSSSGAPMLDDRALDLVERARFRPARVGERPVEATYPVKYHFVLTGNDSPGSNLLANASTLVTIGNQLLDKGSLDQALANFDQAIALEPGNAMAYADRAMTYIWKHDDERAKKDLDRAYALDAHNAIVFHGRGMLAYRAGNLSEAITAFSVALQENPKDQFALYWRGEAYTAAGDFQHASADNGEIVRLNPKRLDLYFKQAVLLRVQHRTAEALQQVQALLAANSQNPNAALYAGLIYTASDMHDEAMRSFDQAVEMEGGERAYLTRAQYRPHADTSGRKADLEAALQLNPKSIGAAIALAELQADGGDSATAIQTLNAALTVQPHDFTLLTQRAIVNLKSHHDAQAQEDLETVTTAATTPSRLNTLCWSLATANVALERALKSCDAALAQLPNESAYLDSRGFVLLQMGRNAEALASYDKALIGRPLANTSLYGRGIARRRQGDAAGAQADIEAALLIDARTRDAFAAYGVD